MVLSQTGEPFPRSEDPVCTVIELSEALAESCPVASWITHEERLIFINRAAVALLGGSGSADFLGRSPKEFLDTSKGLTTVFGEDGWRLGVSLRSREFPFRGGIAVFTSCVPLDAAVEACNGIREPLIMTGSDLRIRFFNAAAAKLVGPAAIGEYPWVVLPDPGSDLERGVRRAKALNRRVRFQTRDQSSLWSDNVAYPYSGGVMLIREGPSKAGKDEREQEDREELHRALDEGLDFGFWMADALGRNLFVSESFVRLTGLSRTECAGFGWVQALRAEDRASVLESWLTAVESGESWDEDLLFEGVDGRWYPVLSRGIAVRDDTGAIDHWVGLHLDIGRFRRDLGELEATNDALVRSNQELEVFAFGASHDLQEPLRVIRWMVRLLESGMAEKPGSEQRDRMRIIQESATRMSTLVQDLLQYALLLHAPVTAPEEAEQADLNQVLELAQRDCRDAITESGAVITHGPMPQVSGKSDQFVRVFQNLISNAIKYRRDAAPEIHVSADRRGSEWRFCVADNGEGIEASHHDEIFQPFRRLKGHKVPGSGLGLAICKKIIERYGGRIWVESQPGEGSLFFFTLPID